MTALHLEPKGSHQSVKNRRLLASLHEIEHGSEEVARGTVGGRVFRDPEARCRSAAVDSEEIATITGK